MTKPNGLFSKQDTWSGLQSSFLGYKEKTIRIFLNHIDKGTISWIANE